MGQITRQQLIQNAKDKLELYNQQIYLYERICDFLCRKDLNPLEAKAADDESKFAIIDAKRAITNYFQCLVQLGKIKTDEELQASIKRFAPAKNIHLEHIQYLLKKQLEKTV